MAFSGKAKQIPKLKSQVVRAPIVLQYSSWFECALFNLISNLGCGLMMMAVLMIMLYNWKWNKSGQFSEKYSSGRSGSPHLTFNCLRSVSVSGTRPTLFQQLVVKWCGQLVVSSWFSVVLCVSYAHRHHKRHLLVMVMVVAAGSLVTQADSLMEINGELLSCFLHRLSPPPLPDRRNGGHRSQRHPREKREKEKAFTFTAIAFLWRLVCSFSSTSNHCPGEWEQRRGERKKVTCHRLTFYPEYCF